MPELYHEMNTAAGWVPVPDVREDSPVTITRGRRDQGTGVDRGKCAMKINNRHGKYSEDNPLSQYYGQLGRNTEWRTEVQLDRPRLLLRGNGTAARALTPDDPAIAIAGDLDIRIDFAPHLFPELYATGAGAPMEIIGRYDANNGQRQWRLQALSDGRLEFVWSTTGADFIQTLSTDVPRIVPGVRCALRVTFDVDNGAGGNTVTFYTAPSAAGPWSQVGDPVVTPGVTQIDTTSTVPLTIGDFTGVAFAGMRGSVYSAEVRNGIDGPAVVSVDFTAQTAGATAFTDSTGRPWTVEGADASISARYTRFFGVVPAWPQSWDQSGNDSWVSIEAAGPLRRLDKGSRPVQSTLRKRIPSGDPLEYWPMEDGSRVDRPSSALPGGSPLKVSGLTFAQDDSLSGSMPLPTVSGEARIDGTVAGASADGWHVEMVYKLDQLPAVETTLLRADFEGASNGVSSLRLRVSTAEVRLQLLGDDDEEIQFFVISDPEVVADLTGRWNRLQLYTVPGAGGGTNFCVAWRDVVANTWWVSWSGRAGAPGRITRVRALWKSEIQGLSAGHLSAFDVAGTMISGTPTAGVGIYGSADDAYASEYSTGRIRRVAEEETMHIVTPGLSADGTRMGPQPVGTVMDILRDCEATDGGVLTEHRDAAILVYQPRRSLYNRAPALILDQATGQIAAPLDPVKDDEDIVNSLVVTRSGGGSSDPAALPPEHPLSEANIGLYDKEETYNLYRDEQTDDQAAWRLHMSTGDQARIPTVTLNLRAPAMAGLQQYVTDYFDQQSVIEIRNTLFRPDPVRLVVEGYTERLSATEWTFELNCSPAEPWEYGTFGDAKADSAGSELYTSAGESDSALIITNPGDNPWTSDPAEVPWDIRVGGEIMTVNACSEPVTDTFTRDVADGWGTADTGQSWSTIVGGAPADFLTTGGSGVHAVGSVNVNRYTLMAAPSADLEMSVVTAASVAPTGAGIQSYLVCRYLDESNYYAARVEYAPGGNVHLSITRIVAGVPFAHPAVTVATGAVANDVVNVRFQALGTNLRARAWRLGSAEPLDWQVNVQESALTAAGLCGVRSRVLSGNTNTLPLVVAWDDFELPQTMSVQRSVNGVVKSHPLGEAVRLAGPAVVGY